MENLNEDGRSGRSTGVLPLMGAVPVVDSATGKVRMEKVKVQRYIAGQRPTYADEQSDEERDAKQDVKQVFERIVSEKKKSAKDVKRRDSDYESGDDVMEVKKEEPDDDHQMSRAEYNDPRLRRLNQAKQQRRRRRHSSDDDDKPSSSRTIQEPEIVRQRSQSQSSDSSALSQDVKDDFPPQRQRIRDASDDDDREKDSDEDDGERLAAKRELMRLRSLQAQKAAEAKLAQEQKAAAQSSSEEESSDDEDDYTSSEDDMAPRLKPVYVRKRDRVTLHETAKEAQRLEELKLEEKRMAEQRKRDSQKIVENIVKTEIEKEERQKTKDSYDLESVNTDDESEELSYEEWKVRELQRIKRDKDEREARRLELEEIERVHNMTDEERRAYLRANPRVVTNQQERGKMKFMQKYFHRGVFYLDEEDEVFKRDFTAATLEDRFDKTVLPKVMQVKDFGKVGRTKWTHLVAEDTTDFQSQYGWGNKDNVQNLKFYQQHGGGLKEQFTRPAAKKRKT